MHKYYKKFSNNAMCMMDPRFLGEKKDLILSELGATLCKINRKCGEICLFENPTSPNEKRLKVKRKHHQGRRPHTAGEIKEKVKATGVKETKSIEATSSSKHTGTIERREISKHEIESYRKRRNNRHRRLLEQDSGNVKHLYEDSQTEIYFINTSKGRPTRKRKHLPAKHHPEKQPLEVEDSSYDKYSSSKDKSRRDKDSADFSKKDLESQPITKEPFAVSTLSQLSSLFFKTNKYEKPKEERYKKPSRHIVETNELTQEQKSRPFDKVHHVHHAQVVDKVHHVHHAQVLHKNPLSGSVQSETREKRNSVVKQHADVLEDIQEEKNEGKDDTNKVRHGKGERISIRVHDKTKRRSRKRDTNPTGSPKSLFQNLHVNFGKCIMMEERNHTSKISQQKDPSLLGCTVVSSQHDIKEWIRMQQARRWSRDSLRLIETKRSKSESSLNCLSVSQASALPPRMFKRRSTISEKAEIIFVKSSQRLSRSKSTLPLVVPPEEVSMKLSRDDFVYFIEKLRQSFDDGSVRDVERSLSLMKKKSTRETGKLTRKQKLKRLSRSSYFCIFEMNSSQDIVKRPSKSSSKSKRKNKPEIVLCKDVVNIERLVPQELIDPHVRVSNEMPKGDTSKQGMDDISRVSTNIVRRDKHKEKTATKDTRVEQKTKSGRNVQLHAAKIVDDINAVAVNVDAKVNAKEESYNIGNKQSQLVQTVFNIVNIQPMTLCASGILKPSTKKVSFPESQSEDIVEKKKRTAPFRRYYKYSTDPVESIDNGSQTWSNAFLSDCNIAYGFSDCPIDEDQDDEIDLKARSCERCHEDRKCYFESRIPIKTTEANGKMRLTKQSAVRRRDISSCSDLSSHISTSDTAGDVHKKNKKTKTPSPTYLISSVPCPLEATLKNILQEVASRLEEKPTNNVGISCTISAGSTPRRSPFRRLGTPGRLKSQPSSIRTDSEAMSIGSARSRSSWNVIKKPADINSRSNSAMENRLVSKSTLRYSENSLRTNDTRNASNQPFTIDGGGKMDGRALIDELVQRLADIKQDLVSPRANNFGNEAANESSTKAAKKKGTASRSLSPPKSKLPVHLHDPALETDGAKSFVEANKNIRARIKNYKMKNNLEPKKTYQIITNKKTGVSKQKITRRTASDTSLANERADVFETEEDAQVNGLSVITSRSETNLGTHREATRPQYSRLSSRITLENFLGPKRLNAAEKAADSRSCSINRKEQRSTNSNVSTLFLTKDYRSTSTMSSYQRRKNYDMSMRRFLKLKSENETQKYALPPQVFEVRYLTVTNDAMPKARAPMVTRGTQNTVEQACQVSNVSDSSGESYGQIIRCFSMDEFAAPDVKRGEQPTGGCEKAKCAGCIEYEENRAARKARKQKKNKHKNKSPDAIGERVMHSCNSPCSVGRPSDKPPMLKSPTPQSLIMPHKTSLLVLPSEFHPAHLSPVNSALKSALKMTPSGQFRKDLTKSIQFDLPTQYQVNLMNKGDTGGRVSPENDHTNQSWGMEGFGNYLRNTFLCCCCIRDFDEPPRKKRKWCAKSQKNRNKKKACSSKHPQDTVQNFRVQVNQALDVKYPKTAFDFKLALNDSGDRKRQGGAKSTRHRHFRDTEKGKFFPVEWFRNINSLFFLEQNVTNVPRIFPELIFNSVDSLEGGNRRPAEGKYWSHEELDRVEKENSCRGEYSNVPTYDQANALGYIPKIPVSYEGIATPSSKTRPYPLLRSKSDSILYTRKIESELMSASPLQTALTAVSLSTNYSSCLTTSRRTSIRGSISEVNNTAASNDKASWGDSKLRNKMIDIVHTKQRDINEDLPGINNSNGFGMGTLHRCSQMSDAKSCEILLSSQESGYTSLGSSKTPSPTSFFKRRSIMELFKFPLERAKSRSSITDTRTYAMLNNNEMKEPRSDTFLHKNTVTDHLMRTKRYQQMNKDCQMYAQKVRIRSEQKHDDVDEKNDNYTEISLDVLLGRSTGLSSKRSSHTQFEMCHSNTPSLIILEDCKSEISLVESATDVQYCSRTQSNILVGGVGNFGPSVTKVSKSDGMLRNRSETQAGHRLEIAKSDSYVNNGSDFEQPEFTVKQSFERFSTNISSKMADRDFFQQLLALYQKENVCAEMLYHNNSFFAEQVDLLESKRAVDKEKKKSKHLFKNIFKRKQKNSPKCGKERLALYARDNILYVDSSNRLSQCSLDGYLSDGSREDCVPFVLEQATSLDQLDGLPVEAFQQLAHKVKRHFGPLVKAVSSSKFMNDELKLSGFQKLLERIEQGDLSMLQRNGSLDDWVRDQVTQCFTVIYETAYETLNMKTTKLSETQLDLIKLCATKYRNNISAQLELVAVCIGKQVITTEKQLEAAVIYLSRLEGNRIVSCDELDAYIRQEEWDV